MPYRSKRRKKQDYFGFEGIDYVFHNKALNGAKPNQDRKSISRYDLVVGEAYDSIIFTFFFI